MAAMAEMAQLAALLTYNKKYLKQTDLSGKRKDPKLCSCGINGKLPDDAIKAEYKCWRKENKTERSS